MPAEARNVQKAWMVVAFSVLMVGIAIASAVLGPAPALEAQTSNDMRTGPSNTIVRYYDRQHGVVCYRLGTVGASPLSCVQSR